MGIPPEHTDIGKAIRIATPAGQEIARQEAAQKVAKADEEKKKAAIANAPDLTELVIRANRNLKALQGRSALASGSSQLAGNIASLPALKGGK